MGQLEVILVDTHVVLWLAFQEERVSKKARVAIDDARKHGRGLAISDITLLEIATLEKKRRIALHSTLETFLTEVESRFIVFPITAHVCVRAMALTAAFPNDPADRVISATALVEGIPLVTADDAIRKAKVVSTVW